MELSYKETELFKKSKQAILHEEKSSLLKRNVSDNLL